jgi:hypothetical protein
LIKKEFINKDRYITEPELIQLICSYYEFINEYPSNYIAASLVHNIIFYRLKPDFIAELYNGQNRDKA